MPYRNPILTRFLFLRISIRESISDRKLFWYLTWFFLGMAVLHTGQDFLHAYLKGYTPYLSESLMFKVYWILFIPTLSSLSYHFTKIEKRIPANFHWFMAIAGIVSLSVVHILLVAFFIVIVSGLFFYNAFPFSTPLRYFASEHVYLTVFFYAAAILILRYKTATSVRHAAPPHEPRLTADQGVEFISVSVKGKLIPIPVKDIICIGADRPYVRIHTDSGEYLHASTLKDILALLSSRKFVRVHRSTIINTKFVRHIKSRANGDYDVTLKNGVVVRMSRNYYAAFKNIVA